MAELSNRNKIIIAIAASVAGVMMLGGAMVAAAAALWHHRWEHEWGLWEECCSECDAYSSASRAPATSEEDEFDRYCSEVMDDLAGALGLSAPELEGELAGGKKIMDIANGKGVSLEVMVDSVTSSTGRILEREVAQGDLSPETAEAIEGEVADYATWFLQNSNMLLLRERAWRH